MAVELVELPRLALAAHLDESRDGLRIPPIGALARPGRLEPGEMDELGRLRRAFNRLLAAVVPRLAAEFLLLNMRILNERGALERLTPRYTRRVTMARMGLSYVALEDG